MPEATIIVIGAFRDGYTEIFAEYSSKIRSYLAKLDAVVIRRQLIERTLYGELSPSLFMAIDFPSKEIAASAFYEQEYLDLIPLRDRVFSSFHMYLAQHGEA